jgi:hypothetical protein
VQNAIGSFGARLAIGVLVVSASLAFMPGAARASGTMQVQQTDGSTQTYKNVSVVISNKTLRLTSADKQGTLVVDRAACSFLGKVMRCLPESMTLDQGGGAQRLDFQSGTVYLNSTDTKQPLPATSQQLPPNGIMLSMTTKIGTIVNLTGTIDKHTK